MEKILKLLVMSILSVAALAANAANDSKPSAPDNTEVIHLLFSQMNKLIDIESLDFGQKCKAKTLSCLLEGLTLAMTENSWGSRQKHHGWSTLKCELSATKHRINHHKNINKYHARYAQSLMKYPHPHLWYCTLSWGIQRGELLWHQDLMFSLTLDKSQIIPDSFLGNYTP